MSKPFSIEDLEDAMMKSIDNMGSPDILMMGPGTLAALMNATDVYLTDTIRLINDKYVGTRMTAVNPTARQDFEIMKSAARAFLNIKLDKPIVPK